MLQNLELLHYFIKVRCNSWIRVSLDANISKMTHILILLLHVYKFSEIRG